MNIYLVFSLPLLGQLPRLVGLLLQLLHLVDHLHQNIYLKGVIRTVIKSWIDCFYSIFNLKQIEETAGDWKLGLCFSFSWNYFCKSFVWYIFLYIWFVWFIYCVHGLSGLSLPCPVYLINLVSLVYLAYTCYAISGISVPGLSGIILILFWYIWYIWYTCSGTSFYLCLLYMVS